MIYPFDLADGVSPSRLETLRGAQNAHPAFSLDEHDGPFIVLCREFQTARQMVFDTYAEAVAQARALSKAVPGHAVMICAPVGYVLTPPPKFRRGGDNV